MKLAISSAALPHPALEPENALLARLPDYGVTGMELDARGLWQDRLPPTAKRVARVALALRGARLHVIGLRVDLCPELGLGWLGDAGAAQATLACLRDAAAICRDLGGCLLTIGAGRWRGELDTTRAWRRSRAFFQELLDQVADYGVTVCLAPLSGAGGDFCIHATDCRILADGLDHPAFGLQIHAAALSESPETGRHAIFASHYGRLELFVADEPEGRPLAASGNRVDHAAMRRHLAAGGYRDWVCLRQRPAPFAALTESLAFFRATYQRPDNLSLQRRRPTPAAMTDAIITMAAMPAMPRVNPDRTAPPNPPIPHNPRRPGNLHGM